MTDSSEIPYTPNGIKEANAAFRASSSLLLAMHGHTRTITEEDESLEVFEYRWTDEAIASSYVLNKYYDEFLGAIHEFHQLTVEATYPDGQSSCVIHQLDDYNHSFAAVFSKTTTQMEEERERRWRAAEQAGLVNTFTVTDSTGKKYNSYVDLSAPDPALQISMLIAVVDAQLNRLNH